MSSVLCTEDYKTLKKQDSDGFEIDLRQSVEKYAVLKDM